MGATLGAFFVCFAFLGNGKAWVYGFASSVGVASSLDSDHVLHYYIKQQATLPSTLDEGSVEAYRVENIHLMFASCPR